MKPIIVTPTKTNVAKAKVTMIWLVTVKEYGNIPIMLQNKTKRNKVKIKGKKGLALDPAVSEIIFATNKYDISDNNCNLDGIKDFF